MAIYRDEGISGTKGRDKRPGLDALLGNYIRSPPQPSHFKLDQIVALL